MTVQQGSAAQSASPSKVIDIAVLRRTLGNDADLICEVVAEFIPAAHSGIAEIRAAVASAVPEQVRQASHKLKGSGSVVGAHRLVEVCSALEAAGRSGNWPVIEALVPRLDGLLSEIEAAAQAFLRPPES
jgi:two-component system sensor histidine kinase/response regulator